MYTVHDTLAGGLPHSDIHGSTPARGSPWLFAACHVLHRLLVPRHPPNALLILDTVLMKSPSATTMHGNHRQIRSRQCQSDQHQQNQSRMIPSSHFSTKYSHNASEPSPSNAGGLAVALADNNRSPGQTCAERRDPHRSEDQLESHAPRDAPEPYSPFKRT
jgi:hypothetical protein